MCYRFERLPKPHTKSWRIWSKIAMIGSPSFDAIGRKLLESLVEGFQCHWIETYRNRLSFFVLCPIRSPVVKYILSGSAAFFRNFSGILVTTPVFGGSGSNLLLCWRITSIGSGCCLPELYVRYDPCNYSSSHFN